MKTKHFYYLALLAALFIACDKSEDELREKSGNGLRDKQDNELTVQKEIFSGYAQKGPFINGSSVTISELKPNFEQTGSTYFTTISDNSGSFELKNLKLNSHYAYLKVDGYYYNEISGRNGGHLTLYALVDMKDANSANVNVLTHLEKPRVEYLVKEEKKSFTEAKQQAQREVLAIFGFEPPATSSEALNLTDNAALLAVSCILQGYISTGDMMELMANICTDIRTDGTLDNIDLGSKLMNNAYAISHSLVNIRNNLTTKYTELGSDNVTIPDFEKYIQSFIDSGLYPQKPLITYPATGLYGDNILSDAVTSVKKGREYSMKADLLEGLSLKIVVKDGLWYYVAIPFPLNWIVSLYDNTLKRQEFTVVESGKPNDLNFTPDSGTLDENRKSYITIEYYENGSIMPVKVKRVYIEN